MDKSDILTLFDYNYWASARILDAAGRVTPEQFTAPYPLSHGSLRGTLVHGLGAEVNWRLRCQEGVSPTSLLQEAGFPTFESLRSRWDAEEKAMRGYLAGLTDDALQQRIAYRTLKGIPQETILWQILTHVVNHGTQTRSEAGLALTGFGSSPGDIDFSLFLRETGR